MPTRRLSSSKLQKLISNCLKEFHKRRLEKLNGLQLNQVLKRKNPYLYKAVGTQSATELVEALLLAFVSSSDETIFGDLVFEPVARAVSGGVVSNAEGVDIDVETSDRYLAISVKSGPNPYNSSARKKQNQEFLALRSRIQKLKKQFDALLGYCYGQRRSEPTNVKVFRERAGQEFWEELTGDPDFYVKLINMIETKVVNAHRVEFKDAWDKAVNRYVHQFTTEFCDEDGSIKWDQLVKFNSSARPSKKSKS